MAPVDGTISGTNAPLLLDRAFFRSPVTDGKGIYKTGQQIITEHLSTSVGAASTAQTVSVTFSDEAALEKLQQIQASYPNTAIYLSGSVAVDMPEEVKLTVEPNQFQTTQLVGSTLTFSFQPLDQALLQLREQYLVGTLTVKVMQPKPEW